MSYVDLKDTLADWPFEPEKISVRKILGTDGVVRLQMRVELGVIQMETVGRPDGQRPGGFDSLLSRHKTELLQYEACNGTTLGFSLSPEESIDLRNEASLFYRRYVALFVLEEYVDVARDTSHNLEVFDLCRDHALEREDQFALEEFRPYVLMMDARARAYAAMQEGEAPSALAHVNRGILQIKAHYARQDQSQAIDTGEELGILQALASELVMEIPHDSPLITHKALRAAVRHERFEEAARLRDQLRKSSKHLR
ncbi:MAG: UvrB/UvrC motif-containing protein [Planctomycetes bacterium]|nr:UvrB/UvrC motif-containing protein [Planctomycetota bacterium]